MKNNNWEMDEYEYQKKKPYTHKGTRLYNSSEGGVSSIIRADESAHDSSLSVLDNETKVSK